MYHHYLLQQFCTNIQCILSLYVFQSILTQILACLYSGTSDLYFLYIIFCILHVSFFLFYMFYTYKVLECLCSCTLRLYFLYICILPYFIHTKLWRDYAVGHWACIFCKPSSDSFSRKTPAFLAHQSTGNRKKITLIRPFSLDFTISYLHQSLHQICISHE